MDIVNLTQHTINEVTTGKAFIPSGIIARVRQATKEVCIHNGVPIYTTELGKVENLPERVKGTIYIVPALVLNAVPRNRTDVVSPGNLRRDENGRPIGCVGFRMQ